MIMLRKLGLSMDCLKFSTTDDETVAEIVIPKHLLKDAEELLEL